MPIPLVIFDWDDTIFPTSWLLNVAVKRMPAVQFMDADEIAILQQIEYSLWQIFHFLKSTHGQFAIVTSATPAWFRITSNFMAPRFATLLSTCVPYICARDQFPSDSIKEAKRRAFQSILEKLEFVSPNETIHLIIIGNDSAEITAADTFRGQAFLVVKTVQFQSSLPNLLHFKKQWDCMMDKFDRIVTSPNSIKAMATVVKPSGNENEMHSATSTTHMDACTDSVRSMTQCSQVA